MTLKDGYLHPGEKPGIGVEFNEEAAAAFPYQQAYLPYDRLVDGTCRTGDRTTAILPPT